MSDKLQFPRSKGRVLSGKRTEIDSKSKDFPEGLRNIPDPPQQLYVIGDLQSIQEGLAIVGARKASPYGLSCARHFARRAAQRGICIISGGALGCDSAAHEAALDVGRLTVAFLGGGCDELYPASNFSLFQRIVQGGGAVVSEHEWNHPPLKHTFRARNRLIAGLAKATLIVEASLPSGTFSTADEALAANREVLVVPGSISSPSSRGANRLIYQGATPIIDDESFDDILFALFGVLRQESCSSSQKKYPESTPAEQRLYEALCAEALRMDEMSSLIETWYPSIDSREVVACFLAVFQKEGLIARYPNGRYGSSRLNL